MTLGPVKFWHFFVSLWSCSISCGTVSSLLLVKTEYLPFQVMLKCCHFKHFNHLQFILCSNQSSFNYAHRHTQHLKQLICGLFCNKRSTQVLKSSFSKIIWNCGHLKHCQQVTEGIKFLWDFWSIAWKGVKAKTGWIHFLKFYCLLLKKGNM